MGSFSRLTYHIVFGTKQRHRSLNDNVRSRVHEYLCGTIKGISCQAIEVGGVEDHVHILCSIPPTIAVADCVRTVTTNSSRWFNEELEPHGKFAWQKGYGAFSVSHSQIQVVRNYIRDQEEHHRSVSFQEEYERILRKHEIPFERKWLFEDEHSG